ncbi:MAG: DUF4337 domain-containing protein [Humidesulfovibrio sp.]|uniref:DUF4337 domain-containing protein n=1 Tax=Humidesulfovibrio sp. TaxID=2910988 RepID=UPI002736B35C|nr:DUF4337 domain-containing protein [Humidesulfovibrio sp.]MDP2848292.1 DUF4337 domain-containing protein [Humidesulfovibrio sp.]
MAEEKKETWLGYVAVTTIVFAVCATLSTFKGGQHSTRAVLSQSKATNQWAYYQAKDLKQYLHELQRDSLDLALLNAGKAEGGYAKAVTEKAGGYAAKIDKYEVQKEEIKKQAEAYDAIIAQAQAHSGAFGMAIIFLQIAILLSSVAALMKIKAVWYGGMAVGTLGLVFFANGFFLFF